MEVIFFVRPITEAWANVRSTRNLRVRVRLYRNDPWLKASVAFVFQLQGHGIYAHLGPTSNGQVKQVKQNFYKKKYASKNAHDFK